MSLDDEQKLLLNVQEKLNRMIVFQDLYHLPEVVNLINNYCQLNNIDKRDLKNLCRLYRRHGPFCVCIKSDIMGSKEL